MKTILKTAAIAALITGFANTAQAMDFTPLTEAPGAVYLTAELEDADCFGGYAPEGFTQSMASRTLAQETLKTGPTRIAVARLHGGRFLPLPHQEMPAWTAIDGAATFTPLSAATHFELLPEIPIDGVDSDNKIDEIRLAAAASGHDYVLIYAVGDGADWARLGPQLLEDTGLTVSESSDANLSGDAKALLVQSYTGEVIGAVTTFAPDMKTLTGLVAEMASHVLDV